MIETLSNDSVTVRDIKICYHLLPSPTIKWQGKLFARPILNELLRYFFSSDSDHIQDSWRVTKEMFYEYYHCISLAIESDDLFELIIRQSWSIPNAFLFGKPMGNGGDFDFSATNEGVLTSMTSLTSQSIELDSLPLKSADIGSLASPSLDNGYFSLPLPMAVEFGTSRSKKLSPTTIAATRTPSRRIVTRRVIVVHSDNTEEVVMVEEEIGAMRFDHESISQYLTSIGITDIKIIKF